MITYDLDLLNEQQILLSAIINYRKAYSVYNIVSVRKRTTLVTKSNNRRMLIALSSF